MTSSLPLNAKERLQVCGLISFKFYFLSPIAYLPFFKEFRSKPGNVSTSMKKNNMYIVHIVLLLCTIVVGKFKKFCVKR
jgi:hypothetical protein